MSLEVDEVFAPVKDVMKIVILYLAIGGGFYLYYNDDLWTRKGLSCAEGEVCVRFCCYNESHCDDEGYFKIHDVSELEQKVKYLNKNFKVLKGLECDEVYEAEAEWRFMEV